ncbi:MAG: aminopeptidase P N-terminal domain-containing protein, partial [Nocardioides sp.]|nr:aminopeptidase P N-terminal domain-containing protein [Nocardioides sp.]
MSETENTPKTETHDQAVPEAWSTFMRQGWGDRELDLPPHPITPYAAARRQRLADAFPGERLVLPSGGYKVRANDTDYRFRSDTAHTYFSGNQTSDAVLVIEGGEATLFARPRSSR